MIDGQQRVTAFMTAIMGLEVINSDFEKKRIKISFNPLAIDEDEVFKVQDNAGWIQSIITRVKSIAIASFNNRNTKYIIIFCLI